MVQKTQIITVLPYILILIANILYLYTRGLDQNIQFYEIFLYNFLLMVIVGIYIILHVNMLLHKWLIEQNKSENEDNGKISMKQVLRKKVSHVLELKYFVTDMFNYGNQEFLVKVYLGIVVVKWVLSLFPGVLVGLLFFLYYQYKKPIDNKLQPIKKRLWQRYQKLKCKLLKKIPKHSKIREMEKKAANTQINKTQ